MTGEAEGLHTKTSPAQASLYQYIMFVEGESSNRIMDLERNLRLHIPCPVLQK